MAYSLFFSFWPVNSFILPGFVGYQAFLFIRPTLLIVGLYTPPPLPNLPFHF
uniref:Uncharacterized protein n=1 Tax=Picea glauca TaxID=3330 RepID=A0A101LY69_PICGL|nr:hypothetical protein ABT39_MTgene5703 [Picea glauca]